VTSGEPLDYLSLEDLLDVAVGVVGDVVVRDRGLLASAAARPRTTVSGQDAYPTLADNAAALMHSLARNQALVVAAAGG
jgi:death on curing protein